MEAIQQPHKITVSADDFAIPASAGDFIVSVLKHKHALLLGDGGDGNGFFRTGGCNSSSSKRSAQSRGIGAPISTGRRPKAFTAETSPRKWIARASVVSPPASTPTLTPLHCVSRRGLVRRRFGSCCKVASGPDRRRSNPIALRGDVGI